MLTRRRLIQSGLTTAAAASFGPTFWRTAFAAQPAKRAPVGPYGWLRPADANGIMLPPRFSSRVIARSTEIIPGTGYRFPAYPDGAATFDRRRRLDPRGRLRDPRRPGRASGDPLRGGRPGDCGVSILTGHEHELRGRA